MNSPNCETCRDTGEICRACGLPHKELPRRGQDRDIPCPDCEEGIQGFSISELHNLAERGVAATQDKEALQAVDEMARRLRERKET